MAVNRDSRPESAPGIEKQRSHRQKVLSEHQNASTADVLTRDWGILQEVRLLKRGLTGTYVAVEPFHLDRYVDEQAFRYNNRATRDNPLNDLDRFALAVSQIAGKRLTYAELTGKTEPPTSA